MRRRHVELHDSSIIYRYVPEHLTSIRTTTGQAQTATHLLDHSIRSEPAHNCRIWRILSHLEDLESPRATGRVEPLFARTPACLVRHAAASMPSHVLYRGVQYTKYPPAGRMYPTPLLPYHRCTLHPLLHSTIIMHTVSCPFASYVPDHYHSIHGCQITHQSHSRTHQMTFFSPFLPA